MSQQDTRSGSRIGLPGSTPRLIGRLLNDRIFIMSEHGKRTCFNGDIINATSTVFMRDCENGAYTFDNDFTKLMIENCKNLEIVVNKKIVTSMIEVWNSNNINLKLHTSVHTLQVDRCRHIDIEFDDPDKFHSVVWTATDNLDLRIFEDAQEKHTFSTGQHAILSTTGSEDDSARTENDSPYQYIIRLIRGRLANEELIRAERGFPITKREWSEWARRNLVQ